MTIIDEKTVAVWAPILQSAIGVAMGVAMVQALESKHSHPASTEIKPARP